MCMALCKHTYKARQSPCPKDLKRAQSCKWLNSVNLHWLHCQLMGIYISQEMLAGVVGWIESTLVRHDSMPRGWNWKRLEWENWRGRNGYFFHFLFHHELSFDVSCTLQKKYHPEWSLASCLGDLAGYSVGLSLAILSRHQRFFCASHVIASHVAAFLVVGASEFTGLPF